MRIAAGILLLVAGIAFPMGMVFWLNGRLNRRPLPSPGRVGLLIAFNGLLPVGLVLTGLGLLAPHLWQEPGLRIAALAVWLATGAVLVLMMVSGWAGARRDRDGG